MVAVVTGAAGFIGSHLCAELAAAGHEVRGVDAFTGYYARAMKEENIASLRSDPGFSLVEADLVEMPLASLLDGADVVYHLAAEPGVRASWGPGFARYTRHNLLATERLLEACSVDPPRKFVFASSSSVYGEAARFPTPETTPPRPVSPYGVTKLAAEHLCEIYQRCYGVPTACLRLFTVYGPRQRPDMAFARLVASAIDGGIFELYGDGRQTRDCTFVGDVVAAMQAVAASDWVGIANIGGGHQVSMNEAIALVSEICGDVLVVRGAEAAGDVRHTGADTRLAASAFGYRPDTTLEEGLRAMVEWARPTATKSAKLNGAPVVP
jgi:nucleoside-diphosphate-sugar epimerase